MCAASDELCTILFQFTSRVWLRGYCRHRLTPSCLCPSPGCSLFNLLRAQYRLRFLVALSMISASSRANRAFPTMQMQMQLGGYCISHSNLNIRTTTQIPLLFRTIGCVVCTMVCNCCYDLYLQIYAKPLGYVSEAFVMATALGA